MEKLKRENCPIESDHLASVESGPIQRWPIQGLLWRGHIGCCVSAQKAGAIMAGTLGPRGCWVVWQGAGPLVRLHRARGLGPGLCWPQQRVKSALCRHLPVKYSRKAR